MTETLHWYAETSGGVRQGDAPVHSGCGAVHLSACLLYTSDAADE